MLRQLIHRHFAHSLRKTALRNRRPRLTRYILKLSLEIRELTHIAATIQSDPHQREDWALLQRHLIRLENRRRLANHQYSRLQAELN